MYVRMYILCGSRAGNFFTRLNARRRYITRLWPFLRAMRKTTYEHTCVYSLRGLKSIVIARPPFLLNNTIEGSSLELGRFNSYITDDEEYFTS